MKDETIKRLKKLAESQACKDNDDFAADDYSGDNFDDAWDYGMGDGEIYLARTILEDEGIDFIKPG